MQISSSKFAVQRGVNGAGVGLHLGGLLVVASWGAGASARTAAVVSGAFVVGSLAARRIPSKRIGRWRSLIALAGGAVLLGLSLCAIPIAAHLTSAWLAPEWIAAVAIAISGFLGGLLIGSTGPDSGHASPTPAGLAGVAAGLGATLWLPPHATIPIGALVATAAAVPHATKTRAVSHVWIGMPLGFVGVTVASAAQSILNPSLEGQLAVAVGVLLAAAASTSLVHRFWRIGALAVVAIASCALAASALSGRHLGPMLLEASETTAPLFALSPLLLLGATFGAFGAPLTWSRTGLAAVGGGLLVGATFGNVDWLWVTAIASCLLMTFASGPLPTRAFAALMGTILFVADWQQLTPTADDATHGLHRVVRTGEAWDKEQAVTGRLETVSAVAAAGSTSAVRTTPEWRTSIGQRGRPTDWAYHLEQSGSVVTSSGREADAESLAGHIAGSLARSDSRVLLLGDVRARTLGAVLAHPGGAVLASTTAPHAIQTIALLDPDAREAWLSSRVQLLHGHPDTVLRVATEVDLVVERFATSWSDGSHAAPSRHHLDAVRALVGPDGAYVAVIHGAFFDAGSPAAIVQYVRERFGHVQLWIPPSGGDSLILVATPDAPSLAAFATSHSRAARALASIGIRSFEEFVSFAVATAASSQDWSPNGTLPSAHRMPDAIFRKPVMHLGTLSDQLGTPDQLWTWDGAPITQEVLARRIGARGTFLTLLQRSSTGNIEGVFDAAHELVEQEGELATQALSVLIEPQMQKAKAAFVRGLGEGQASSAWEESQRLSTMARMLSPRSPEPLLLLGEIALAQANLNRAHEHFSAAIALDPTRRAGHTGLARVAISRRDFETAEDHLRAATVQQPRDWQAWANLGRHLTETGQAQAAEEALRRAATLAGPDESSPHLRLAELYLSDDRPTTALVHAERAVTLEASAEALYLRGRAYFEVGQLDKAEADFRRAVLTDGGHIGARGAIGHIRALEGDLQSAVETFRQVVAMDPSNAAARENLSRAEAQLRARGFQGPGTTPPP